MIHLTYMQEINSPLGQIILLSDGQHLTGLHFADRLPLEEDWIRQELPVFDKTKRWLSAYFAGKEPALKIDLEFIGTSFQKRVWQELLTIPYGKTTTYQAIAQKLDSAPRAVGGAVGKNPISLIAPCHRVIGKDGSLTGYGGGLDRKEKLLSLEKADY